jgi:hypothetical protein
LEAQVGQVTLGNLEVVVEGESFNSQSNLEIRDIAVWTDAELPQTIAVSGVTVEGLKVDPAQGVEIAAIVVDQLNADITDAILALGGGEAAEDSGDSEAKVEPASTAFRLGRATVSSGSVIKVTDTSVEPPMMLEIEIDNAEVGPIHTSAPETQTAIDLGAAINKQGTIKVLGWVSPLLPTPDLDLTADMSKMPLPIFSPYVSSARGLHIDSGILGAEAKINASVGALKGQIDVLVDELFLEAVSEEAEKKFENSYGVSANFATGILKDEKGQIDLGFQVSGSVEEPKIDYSEVISKAIAGAMASLFPLNWFGEDVSSFEILPATFDPGTVELTSDGEAAGHEIGKILAGKPQLGVRVCGKAAASDLIVLRGGEPPAPTLTPEDELEASEGRAEMDADSDGAGEEQTTVQPAQPLTKPTQQEVDQLLDLATQRGEVMREYLTSVHGVNADRMSECRNSYSTEDGKPPRAEFRF